MRGYDYRLVVVAFSYLVIAAIIGEAYLRWWLG